MNDQPIIRYGGIAVIIAVVMGIAYYVVPFALAISSLCMIVFIIALYHFFRDDAPLLSLIAAVLGIGGAVVTAVLVGVSMNNPALQNSATWATWFAPPLLFGIVAYQQSPPRLPRALTILGLVGGAFGLLNLILTLLAGGDWTNPNNPAVSPFIMGSYYLAMLPTLAWLLWMAVHFLKSKTAVVQGA